MSRKKPRPPQDDPPAPAATGASEEDRLRRLLLRLAAGLFFAGFVVAVAAVLVRPERVVLIGMDAGEAAWYQRSLKTFVDQHHANLKFVAYRDAAQFDSLLAADRRSRSPRIVLVEAPGDRLGALVDSGAVRALRSLPGLQEPAPFLAPFAEAARGPAIVGGTAYFIPSRLTTVCLCYSKARVADAVAHASEARPSVEAWLRGANGIGLPANYRLEDDPSQWDSYDLLMVAAYWASSPFVDGTAPRMAHVVAPPSALGFDLAARAFSMGAQGDAVLALDGFGVRDALAWESLFFAHGLYDTAMVSEAWNEEQVAAAVATGRIWLATLEPVTILRLHGLAGAADSSGRRVNSDIGLARMPRGVSLELKQRSPERSGDPWSARGGHWWAVPTKSPDPALALALVRRSTTPEFQVDAARALGWLPTRKDLVDDLVGIYRDPEEYELARQAARQLHDFGRSLPNTARWNASAAAFAAAWSDACVRRHFMKPLELAEALRLAQAAQAAH